jgi:starch-binding outer membrane protein, SusD/RagB family
MKSSHKNKILMILAVLLLTAGCSEDFLDIGQRGVTSEKDFYKTDDEALQGLMAVYDNLQGMQYIYCATITGLSDEAYAGGGQRGDNGGALEELNEFRVGPANGNVQNLFNLNYNGIYRANKVVDNVTPDTENKRIYIAMAKTMRAFHYFTLVTLWGDVPLVLHELSPSDYAQPRSSVAKVWEQIEKDLNEAILDLPVKNQLPALVKNLASKGTAQSLLGKALLYQKKFSEAAGQFDAVITSQEYNLYGDYSKLTHMESEYSVESIFEVSMITSQSYIGFPGSESSLWIYFASPREPFFQGGTTGVLPGWGFHNPRASLYNAYTAAGDMVRRNATMISEADLIAAGGKLRNVNGQLPYANDGYARLKYVFRSGEGGAPDPRANNGTNTRLIRFADVLLMGAEAHNRKPSPDNTKALQYINRVRDRVALPPLSAGGDALFEAIKNERRLELSFEFVRFQDLIRWGDGAAALANQGKEVPLGTGQVLSIPEAGFKAGKNELLPIPQQEMNVNPNIKVNNPGY